MAKSSEIKSLNWDNPDDYNYLKRLSKKGWAWEILRRNPNYKKDYARYIKKEEALTAKYKDTVGSKKDNLSWLSDAFIFDPPLLPHENLQKWVLRVNEKGKRYSLSEWHAKKWNLYRMYNPDSIYSRKIRFIIKKSPWFLKTNRDVERDIKYIKTESDDLADDPELDISLEQAVVVFDLTYSLDAQLKSVSRVLKKRRESLSVPERRKLHAAKRSKVTWTRYIRLLDALEQVELTRGSKKYIAKVLMEGSSSGDKRPR